VNTRAHSDPDRAESIRIRPAVESDAPALLRFLAAVGEETPYLTFGAEGPAVSEADERAYIARVCAADKCVMLLAEMDGRLVGCLTFEGGARWRIRHVGEFGLSVARSHWGRGVGQALVEALVGWARAGGIVRKLNLRVRADNERAIRLYERLGFTVEGRLARDLADGGRFFDSIAMGLTIDPPDRPLSG
jgi:RimJ/RimL family protein N-acetyltransferase